MPLIDDLREPLGEAEASRRTFLALLGSGALSVATLGTGAVTLRFLSPNVLYEEESRFRVGTPAEFPVGSVTALIRQKIYVVHSERGFYALSAVCTHLGCMTQYERANDRIFCPCHGSSFTKEGVVTGGPAPRPLRRIEIVLERGFLVVDTRRDVGPDQVLEV